MPRLDDWKTIVGMVSVEEFAKPIVCDVEVGKDIVKRYAELFNTLTPSASVLKEGQEDFVEFVKDKDGNLVMKIDTAGHPITEILDTVGNSVLEQNMSQDDVVSLAKKDGKLIGFILYDEPAKTSEKDIVFPLLPQMIVSRDTTVLELVEIFADEELWEDWWKWPGHWGKSCPVDYRYLFVLTTNRITHTVRYENILGLPLRMVVFTLLISLENRILRLLFQVPPLSVLSLNTRRLGVAKDLCKQRGTKPQEDGSYSAVDILESTTFIDRSNMLLGLDGVVDSLPFSGRTKAKSFFKRLEVIRNEIAHCRPIVEAREPKFLRTLFVDIQNTLSALDTVVLSRKATGRSR